MLNVKQAPHDSWKKKNSISTQLPASCIEGLSTVLDLKRVRRHGVRGKIAVEAVKSPQRTVRRIKNAHDFYHVTLFLKQCGQK